MSVYRLAGDRHWLYGVVTAHRTGHFAQYKVTVLFPPIVNKAIVIAALAARPAHDDCSY
jgi:hypothetical protein